MLKVLKKVNWGKWLLKLVVMILTEIITVGAVLFMHQNLGVSEFLCGMLSVAVISICLSFGFEAVEWLLGRKKGGTH